MTPLAIVSDVHGNFTALEAVTADLEARGIERVVHGGDLAVAGCQGAEVVDRIRELGWPGIVGSTDELLWGPEEHEAQVRGAPKLAPVLSTALIDDGRAEIVRVAYDVEREIETVMRSGYPDAERIAEMRRTGTFVPVA